MTSSALETLDTSRENMIFAATVAKNYKQTFGDLSNKVLFMCLELLFESTKGAGDILALIMETKNNFPEANLDIVQELIAVGNEILKVPGI